MTLPPLDLAGCAAEPIRLPGAIQPHGWLLAYDGGSGRLVACSDNCDALTGQASGDAQTAALQTVLDELRSRVSPAASDGAPVSIGRVMVDGRSLDATHTCTGATALIELEPSSEQRGTQGAIYGLARRFVPSLQKATSVVELAALAAAEMKQLTCFGRCVVYSFDDEGHGNVLAEQVDEGYDCYLGHRFPATDIPPQARDLYLLNHIRLIPDANYQPVALRSVDQAVSAGALDLSYAQLRSVSPVHLEYMRNMGTLASMSVSIVVRGQLWGLISCHDHAPHGLDMETRFACEHLGGLLALQIEAKEDNADVQVRHQLRSLALHIVSRMGDSGASLQSLLDEPAWLAGVTRAAGTAVVFNDQCWRSDDTPSEAQILALADWIFQRGAEVYATDDLRAAGAPTTPDLLGAAGLLAISLSQVHRHLVIWFRPERVRRVRWAGEASKHVDDQQRLHPRRSFESWEEIVRGTSVAWAPSEIAAATELRQALVGIVLHRAQERDVAAGRLGRVTLAKEMAEQANSAKMQFLAVLSHELRSPLASIANAAELIARNTTSPENMASLGALIKRNVAVEARLIDDLLDLSAISAGKLNLSLESVDIDAIVQDVADMLHQELMAKDLQLSIEASAVKARVAADPVRIQQVLWNILRNAQKFTPRGGRIQLVSEVQDGNFVVTCTDSGVGIEAAALHRIFIAYEQVAADTYQRFGGLGLGLAIAMGIVKSHGGELLATSAGRGHGAAFTLRLPLGSASGSPQPLDKLHSGATRSV